MSDIRTAKLNNRGLALVSTIITMLFVGILVAAVIAIASANIEQVKIIRETTDTFYSAEEVIDEIRTRFSEYADEAMRLTYTKWLQTYTDETITSQEDQFLGLYKVELRKILIDKFIDPIKSASSEEAARDILNNEVLYNHTVGTNITLKLIGDLGPVGESTRYDEILEEDNGKLVVKGIKVNFEDEAGLTTYISTDMVFDVMYPGFSSVPIEGQNLVCLKYAIMTDKYFKLRNFRGTVDANVYTWQGLLASENDTNAEIKTDTFISGGVFEACNGAQVTVVKQDSNSMPADIWAQNIRMTCSDTISTSAKISSNCNYHVEDDLTIDAKTGSFIMNSGEYTGYSSGNFSGAQYDQEDTSLAIWSGTADGSSAMIINGTGATLDITNADNVWIAGKAFIVVPKVFGHVLGSADLPYDTTRVYIEGESISYKGQQAGYLVPGDCIAGIGHNPMTADEYSLILRDKNKTETDPTRQYYVDMTISPTTGDLRIEDYLSRQTPYRVARVKYLAGEGVQEMIYLYMNFQNADKAQTFFYHYSTLMEKLVDSRMATFTGTILFDRNRLVATGNQIEFTQQRKLKVYEKTTTYNAEPIIDKNFEESAKYSGLLSALDENYMGTRTTEGITHTLVKWDRVDAAKTVGTALTGTERGEYIPLAIADLDAEYHLPNAGGILQYYLYVGDSNGDVVINHNTGGLILADGDVEIIGCNFYGMIMAKGNITVRGTGNIIEDQTRLTAAVEARLGLENNGVVPYDNESNEITIDRLFVPTVTGMQISMSEGKAINMISIDYRNWRKNE